MTEPARAPTSAGLDLLEHRALLWAIAYRMTGVAADADDVVQETLTRALAHPPSRARPLRPWLITVAMNVARDTLRRRRRTTYVGPWLPSPVPDHDLALDASGLADVADVADDRPGPEQRYSLHESATFAFLLAVEALTPLRRAVLILRDVFDYSAVETARALGISSDAVKQNLSRARKSLAGYRAAREPLASGARRKCARDEAALGKLLYALSRGDTDAVEELLADDVEAHSDGGGVYTAARVIVCGPTKVGLVYRNLARLMAAVARTGMKPAQLNGAPAVVLRVELDDAWSGRIAPRTVMSVDTDERGKITRIYSVMAPRKLTAVGS